MKRIFKRNCTGINVARGWLDGEEVRLMLWDTAGQEEFDAITKAYYRGAQACVLAFSTTDRDSFEAAHSWKMKELIRPSAKKRLGIPGLWRHSRIRLDWTSNDGEIGVRIPVGCIEGDIS
uniref:Uncharacterized protein n=1 Tax=Timema monikensis TaxID=170555 RepID=A0A7R9E9I1_9NEOP|nr:unnamed protein product [Timema monikensis]